MLVLSAPELEPPKIHIFFFKIFNFIFKFLKNDFLFSRFILG
jgi:hypothetical protein